MLTVCCSATRSTGNFKWLPVNHLQMMLVTVATVP